MLSEISIILFAGISVHQSFISAAAAALDSENERELNRNEESNVSFANVYTSTPKKKYTDPQIPMDLSCSMSMLEDDPIDLSFKENLSDSAAPLNLAVNKSRSSGSAQSNSQPNRSPLNLITNCGNVFIRSGNSLIETGKDVARPGTSGPNDPIPATTKLVSTPFNKSSVSDSKRLDSGSNPISPIIALSVPKLKGALRHKHPDLNPPAEQESITALRKEHTISNNRCPGAGSIPICPITASVTPELQTAFHDRHRLPDNTRLENESKSFCLESDNELCGDNMVPNNSRLDEVILINLPKASAGHESVATLREAHQDTVTEHQLENTSKSSSYVMTADEQPEGLDSNENFEDEDDVPIGDATLLNMFSIEEYFQPYINATIVDIDADQDEDSSNDENDPDTDDARKKRKSAKSNDIDGDLGFQDISCEKIEQPRKVCCNKVNKLRKERGLSYKRWNGSTAPARCIKAACKCQQLECYSKYSDEVRKALLTNLLKLSKSAQNQFISNHMTVVPAASSKVINSRRSYSRKYFLPGVGGMVNVCKSMFLSTLDVGVKKVRHLAQKKVDGGGLALDDQRCYNTSRNPIPPEHVDYIKSHIHSFPSYSSHYGREKSTRKYLSSDLNVSMMYELYTKKCSEDNPTWRPVHYNSYRMIFKTFNLSFRKPKVDSCDKCNKLKVELQAAKTDASRTMLEKEREDHHARAKFVYDHKKKDVEEAKTKDGVLTLSFDLQKCLPTPYLTTGRAFYSRQLYTYNLTVFATSKGQNTSHCFLWDERKARRGSQEIGSCVFKFVKSFIESAGYPVHKVNLYSDKCSGQNHNFVMCMMFAYLSKQLSNLGKSTIITHNFMVSGHSHMEVDSIHAAIERSKKASTIDIEIPRDYSILISQIRRKVPIKVIEMEPRDFLAFKKLDIRYKRPKFNSIGMPVQFNTIMSFEYRTESEGTVFYKSDPREVTFSQFQIADEKSNELPELSPITVEPLELPAAKVEDLRSLLPFIKNKEYYLAFLKTLAPPKRGRKKKKVDDDSFDNDLSCEET